MADVVVASDMEKYERLFGAFSMPDDSD